MNRFLTASLVACTIFLCGNALADIVSLEYVGENLGQPVERKYKSQDFTAFAGSTNWIANGTPVIGYSTGFLEGIQNYPVPQYEKVESLDLIKELFGRYGDTVGNDYEKAAAMQVAVWEIYLNPANNLDVTKGSFKIFGLNAAHPIAWANTWLWSLDGNADYIAAGDNYISTLHFDGLQDQIIVLPSMSMAPMAFSAEFQVSTVPEPSTFCGLGLGLAALVAFRMRKRFKKNAADASATQKD